MVKAKKAYQCNECGMETPKWAGQCGDCGKWNTLSEVVIQAPSKSARQFSNYSGDVSGQIKNFADIKIINETRISTGLAELDRALGGGLVIGSVSLVGGDPGIGKSTLLLQAMVNLGEKYNVLYVTGEESLQQVAMRAKRLGFENPNIKLLSEIQTEKIIAAAQSLKPQVLVVDSIQTLCSYESNSAPGAVSQVRESAAQLVQYAKQTGTSIFIVGHVTKDGTIAGPRVLEHMVDTVLYFEGDPNSRFRALRACKNRFGAVNELGIFAMTERGLSQVENPSAVFIANKNSNDPGSAVTVTWEGTRPMLVEVQALVDKSYADNPRRMAVGIDYNRLIMVLAVLSKHVGIFTHDQDIFVNVVGGVKISETAVDLAVACAIVSSLKNKPISPDRIIFGEIGLAGELRPALNAGARLKEAAKHGFKSAVLPEVNLPGGKYQDLNIKTSKTIKNALGFL